MNLQTAADVGDGNLTCSRSVMGRWYTFTTEVTHQTDVAGEKYDLIIQNVLRSLT